MKTKINPLSENISFRYILFPLETKGIIFYTRLYTMNKYYSYDSHELNYQITFRLY